MLGSVVAIVTIEMAVARQDLRLSKTDLLDHRIAFQAAGDKEKAATADVICLGTSMVQSGIIPRVIENRTGERVYNLAVTGGRSANTYYNLRRALAAGATPSAVLVDFHPTLLTKTPELDGRLWADSIELGDCFDMACKLRDPSVFGETLMTKILPTLYYRNSVRESIDKTLEGGEFSFLTQNLAHLRNREQNRGATVPPGNPGYRGEITADDQAVLLDNLFPFHPKEVGYLRKFFRLAESRNIRVYWVVFPFTPLVQSGRETRGLDARYTRLLNSFRDDPNLVILDARYSSYEASVFRDASHLNLDGANTLSSDIAEVLRHPPDRLLDGPGPVIVAMPRYRPIPIEVSIETRNQSAIAVSKDSALRH